MNSNHYCLFHGERLQLPDMQLLLYCGKLRNLEDLEYNPLLQDDPDVNMPLKDRKIGGFGVFLAKKMSDELTYRRENRQNILTVGMNIK